MLRRQSTEEVIDAEFARLAYPAGYHYDVLRGLDYLRAAGVRPDERTSEAIDIVASKRDPAGRWLLENPHDVDGDNCLAPPVTELLSEMREVEGELSRWITLRGLRVLRWAVS